jgi:cytoskeletal protein RodZ
MSALWAPLQAPAEERADRAKGSGRAGRGLWAVPPLPARMARIPFITVLIAVFGVGMVGLLVVNTSLQNQAFESRALNRQAAQLVYAEAELQSRLNEARTPEQVASKASALGMRANPYPAFLVVPSGKVIGEQHRVTGTEMKGLIVKTPAQLAAEKAAKEAKARAKAAAAAAKKKAEAEAAQKAAAAKAAAEAAKKAQAEAAARQQAATAAAQQRAAEAAKKKSQQGGGN